MTTEIKPLNKGDVFQLWQKATKTSIPKSLKRDMEKILNDVTPSQYLDLTNSFLEREGICQKLIYEGKDFSWNSLKLDQKISYIKAAYGEDTYAAAAVIVKVTLENMPRQFKSVVAANMLLNILRDHLDHVEVPMPVGVNHRQFLPIKIHRGRSASDVIADHVLNQQVKRLKRDISDLRADKITLTSKLGEAYLNLSSIIDELNEYRPVYYQWILKNYFEGRLSRALEDHKALILARRLDKVTLRKIKYFARKVKIRAKYLIKPYKETLSYMAQNFKEEKDRIRNLFNKKEKLENPIPSYYEAWVEPHNTTFYGNKMLIYRVLNSLQGNLEVDVTNNLVTSLVNNLARVRTFGGYVNLFPGKRFSIQHIEDLHKSLKVVGLSVRPYLRNKGTLEVVIFDQSPVSTVLKDTVEFLAGQKNETGAVVRWDGETEHVIPIHYAPGKSPSYFYPTVSRDNYYDSLGPLT